MAIRPPPLSGTSPNIFYSFLAPIPHLFMGRLVSAVDYLFLWFFLDLLLLAFDLLEQRDEAQASLRTDVVRWLTFAGVFVGGAWFMRRAATFTFLIDYERQDYPQRLFSLVNFSCCRPQSGVVRLWMRLKHQPSLTLYSFVLIAMAWQGHAFIMLCRITTLPMLNTDGIPVLQP
jgi:hypothetical protein